MSQPNEGYFCFIRSDDPFFPTYPEVAFQEGNFHTEVSCPFQMRREKAKLIFTLNFKVDILLGSNGEEGLLGTQIYGAMPGILPTIMDNWGVWGPILLLQVEMTNEMKILLVNSITEEGLVHQ